MFHELGTPENRGWKWSQYFTYSLYGASERTVKTRVGRHCGRLLGPLWTDLAKILWGEQTKVWQQMIGISLMCIDVRRSNGWKTIKNRWKLSVFYGFLAAVPAYVNAHQRNSNYLLPYPSPFTTKNFGQIGQQGAEQSTTPSVNPG